MSLDELRGHAADWQQRADQYLRSSDWRAMHALQMAAYFGARAKLAEVFARQSQAGADDNRCSWCGRSGHRAHACPMPRPAPGQAVRIGCEDDGEPV